MSKGFLRVGGLFIVLFSLTLLCLPVSSSARVYQGTWRKNTKWCYDTKTKTVTIDCNGRMDDYLEYDQPEWREWYNKAKKIVFKEGITHIGSLSFYYFRKVKEVVLPEGLVSVGAYAFRGTSIKKLRFPSTLRKIGEDAFYSYDLESVSLRNVETIGSGAFSGTNIKSLTIPSTCRDIKSYAFISCFKLKKLTIENGIRIIRNSTFARTGLRAVTIPPSVTEIGPYAFFAFSPEESKLKRVTIQSTNIKKWGKNVFGKARKDLVIYVPKSKKKEYRKALRKGGLPKYVKVVGKESSYFSR